MVRLLTATAWITAGVLLVASPAEAQSAAPARERFTEGMAALERGRFDEAADRFRQSLALEPRLSTSYNLALALRGSGRLVEALETLESALGSAHDEPPSRESALRSLVAELAAEIAQLTVHVEGPDDAEIRIDGHLVAAGVATRTDPRTHVITASAPDHDAASQEVTLAPGEVRELRLSLVATRRPGVLELRSRDPRAELEIDGVARGLSRLVRSLPAGTYRARLLGSRPREEQVEVQAGRRVVLQFDPLPSASIEEEPLFWVAVVGGVALVVGGVILGLTFVEREPVQIPPFGAPPI